MNQTTKQVIKHFNSFKSKYGDDSDILLYQKTDLILYWIQSENKLFWSYSEHKRVYQIAKDENLTLSFIRSLSIQLDSMITEEKERLELLSCMRKELNSLSPNKLNSKVLKSIKINNERVKQGLKPYTITNNYKDNII